LVQTEILAFTLDLAIEIAQEGREGRRVGALFTLGGADAVLTRSRPLILDPLAGHQPAATHIADLRLRGTIKELAQLDGAFVITGDGVVLAACRYLDVSAQGVEVPLGLGCRHLAASAVSTQPGVIAIAVSESGVVRVFCRGELIAELGPTIWGPPPFMIRSHPGLRPRPDGQEPPKRKMHGV
jgi:DNA integrity scanning protein DisA with diadenylate cyclase activity